MKTIKSITLLTLLALLLAGCDEGNSEAENAQLLREAQAHRQVEPIMKNSTYLTDDSRFVNEVNPNERGEVEITDVLIERGYLSEEKKEKIALSFIPEGSVSSMSHLQVSFWIDEQSDMFNLRVVDPEGKQDTYYRRESIDNILKKASNPINTSKGEIANPLLLLRLFSIGLRVCSYTNCLESNKDALKLNNLYIHHNNKTEAEVYHGTVTDFYAKPEIYSRLPLILEQGGKDVNQTFAVTGAVRLSKEKVETQLLNYMEKVSENRWLNPKSEIRVKTVELDGNDEFLLTTIEKRADEKLYDLKLNVSGLIGYHFDGTLFSVAPEFIAKIKVNGVTIKMLSGETGYTSSDTFKSIPLKKGDEIEVTIYDDDAFYLDKLHTFSFIFDGKKVLNEMETLTSTLEFVEEGQEVLSNAPKYNVKVTITGDPDENHDEGGTLPDFAGAIYVEGKPYVIKEQTNKLVNQQMIEDIPINLGDKVRAVIIEKDVLWGPSILMKHNFIFDANDVINENKKLKLQLEFVEQ